MKRTKQSKLLVLLLAITMAVAMLPTLILAEENGEEPAVPCTVTQGCTLAEGHEGDCAVSNEAEPAACTKTEGCTLEDGHEGACAVTEKTANNVAPLADAEGTTECQHTYSKWTASEDGLTCERKCTKCGALVESHLSNMTAWKAPRMDGNTSSYCRRTCQVEGCTRADSHSIEGTWIEGEDHYSRTCAVCSAVETCDHSSMRPWTIDGDACVQRCWRCTYEVRHDSQWGDYVEADEKEGHYCTGRYCAVCNQANRIDTVEELLAVIEKGFKTLNIDSWEKDAWGYYEAKNNPITISEDVTIDGKGATIQRLGYGHADDKEPTFIVENGATLTLRNLTIRGGGGDMNGSCLIVVEDGNLVLDDGAVLTNGCYGVHVKNGTLVMNEGSVIKENTIAYDSVVLLEKGVFTMNGGEITGNKTGGALICIGSDEKGNPEDAAFVMKGGTISENVDIISGSVVPGMVGMPVIIAQGGTITIDGGKITNNLRGGVMVAGGSLTMNGGEISDNNTCYMGAGIMGADAMGPLGGEGEKIESVITITGGVIKNNKNVLDMPAGTLLGFSENISVEGGEIGYFGGNEETLKIWAALNGVDLDTLTEEEQLEFAKEMGFTEEQLALKPKITGGSFGNDVAKYLDPSAGITMEGGQFVVHAHVLVKTDAKAPTCTEAGNEAYWMCSECKKLFSDENGNEEIQEPVAVLPTGHKLTAVEEKPATHAEAGHKAYWECERCQKMFADAEGTQPITEPEKIPAQGHSFGTEWKSDETGHWHECACGEKANAAAHSYKWVVDKEATETEAGSKHEECEVCGYKKAAVEIPATGTPVQPTEPKPTEPDVPKTGDETDLTMMFAVMAASMLGIGVVAVLLTKKNYTGKYQK